MINIAISLSGGIIILIAGIFFSFPWWLITMLGILITAVIFFILSKIMAKKLTTIFMNANSELQKGRIDRAIIILKEGFRYRRQQPLIASQINAQLGVIYYCKNDYKEAVNYLKKGLSAHYVAQCMLGIIYMKEKKYSEMKKAFDIALRTGRKESIVWSLYAYCLNRIDEKEGAIEVLNKGLKKLKEDEFIKENLLALQNKKKMKMKAYGDQWRQFMLEKNVIRQQQPKHFQPKYVHR
ncbi:MAG: hypothetical protein V1872_09710 [bacterium]